MNFRRIRCQLRNRQVYSSLWVGSLFLITVASASDVLTTADRDEVPLSSVVNSGISGIARLPKNEAFRLDRLAREYLLFKKGLLKKNERELWIQNCNAIQVRSVFCQDDLPNEVKKVDPRQSLLDVDEVEKSVRGLLAGDLSLLRGVSEVALKRATRKLPSLESFVPIAAAVLKQRSCDHFPLNALIASKMEEFFPHVQAKDFSIKLYEHAASCPSESEWADKSKYRLALLSIAEGDWTKAELWLDRLIQNKEGDHFTRALYWKARAAKFRGDLLAFEKVRSFLMKERPINYHSLLLAEKKAFNLSEEIQFAEPKIRLNSESLGAEWNDRVRAIELLQKNHEIHRTKVFFTALERLLDRVEPEAGLYLAVLQFRNHDLPAVFRTLGALIRKSPQVLSRQTLALFFPLKKEHQKILQGASGKSIDPYLLAALIRQESGFDSSARSPAGALGLMQLMPRTARMLGRVRRQDLFRLTDECTIWGSVLSDATGAFSGNVDLALAAYNAGPERVTDWLRRYSVTDPVLMVDLIPFRETREYVSLISRNYYWYLQLYARNIFDQRVEQGVPMSRTQRHPSSESSYAERKSKNQKKIEVGIFTF